MKLTDGKCVFLNIDNKNGKETTSCMIYENRPIACRIFPSYDHNMKECPNKGKSWKSCDGRENMKPVFAFKQ